MPESILLCLSRVADRIGWIFRCFPYLFYDIITTGQHKINRQQRMGSEKQAAYDTAVLNSGAIREVVVEALSF